MTDRDLERRLAAAMERTAPDDLDVILSRCGAQNGSVMKLNALQEHSNIIDVDVTEVKPKRRRSRWLAAACAALVLLGAGGGGLVYHQSYAVASVVSLDVNPSIELRVNRNERVISCTALNTEAAAVLFDMDGGADLKGTKLDVAVNAIVGALVREGYLDSISSAILISVEDNDQDRAARLQAELVASVDGVLKTQAPGTDVFSQVLTTDAGTEYSNFNSGISVGKAALVQKVIERNGVDAAAFDQLAALSVEELNDLLKAGEKRIPIGKAAAALAVEEYAGTVAISSAVVDVDPELDDIPPHYDVELKTAFGEFDYKVDAFTGEVLSGPKDVLSYASSGDRQPSNPSGTGTDAPAPADTSPSNTQPSSPSGAQQPSPAASSEADIGQEAAKRSALDNAGLSESDVTNWKVEREWDDGRLEDEMEFWCGVTEYDCPVDGHTGAVLKCEIDHHGNSSAGHHSDPHHNGTVTGGNTAPSADIGRDAAKAAALSHAGVSESQTTKMKVEQDWDDGRLEYEVEFESGRMEYEYTIDGTTGAILEYEWDD